MRAARTPLQCSILTALAFTLGACGGGDDSGADTLAHRDTLTTPAATAPAGPIGAEVPAADGDAVMDATEFQITDANFATFVKASEALSFLRARDTGVRAMLEQAGSGGDSTNASLLDRLERHPQVSQAITKAGMSVRDYYVMAIALAGAQRNAVNPRQAPPTPTGRKNAEWVQKNQGQLAKLQTWGSAVAR